MASWFIPPILIPIFLIGMITVYALYRGYL